MSDKLTLDASAATAAGMSYGQWKALHPVSPAQQPKPTVDFFNDIRVCPICGKQFHSVTRKYCTEECYVVSSNKRTLERYYRKKKERDKK